MGVLLAAAAVSTDPSRDERLVAALRRMDDWTRLLDSAGRHGLLLVLSRRVASLPEGAVPGEIAAELKRLYRLNSMRSLKTVAELVATLRLLEEAGIRALPFKGPVLAQAVYGDMAARQFCDLDILVDPAAVWDAQHVLQAAGYQNEIEVPLDRRSRAFGQSFELGLMGSNRTPIDLHVAFESPSFQGCLAFDRIWGRRGSLELAGRQIPHFAPDDCFLMLCVHGARHEWLNLELVCSLAELVAAHRGIDWAGLLRAATDSHCRIRCLLGLALADRLLGFTLPPGVARVVDEEPIVERLAEGVTRKMVRDDTELGGSIARLYWALRTLDSTEDKVTTLFKTAFVPGLNDWQPSDLPGQLAPFYAVARPVRLLLTHIPRRGCAKNG